MNIGDSVEVIATKRTGKILDIQYEMYLVEYEDGDCDAFSENELKVIK